MDKVKQYDYRKLRGRIKEKCSTQEAFANGIGRSSAYISYVLNGQSYFNQSDIENGAILLEIPICEIGEYFFTKRVHENETTY